MATRELVKSGFDTGCALLLQFLLVDIGFSIVLRLCYPVPTGELTPRRSWFKLVLDDCEAASVLLCMEEMLY